MDKNSRKKPELLCPAGNLETLKCAVHYGADAVYIGGQQFGLRAMADNFSIAEMAEGADYCHAHGAKLHVTVNIFAHNGDIAGIENYFRELKEAGMEEKIDAFIISDPGVFTLARQILPGIDVHISTQANNTNYLTYKFWHDHGASRVVAARELSLAELTEIREKIPADMEIEAFIHGAMCISYSGRCLLSNYFTGRDANHGACTHPCRWKYALVEEKRPGEYLPVEEDDRGTYIMNSKDLCMIEHIPELVAAGVNSFKIEGRMKTALYVATVARTYRKAIDDYFESEETYRNNLSWYQKEISMCTFRQFTTGFYFHKPTEDAQIYDNNTYISNAIYMGTVEKVLPGDVFVWTQKNKFSVGETLTMLLPDGTNLQAQVARIVAEDGTEQESAPHPKQILYVTLPGATQQGITEGTVIRRE